MKTLKIGIGVDSARGASFPPEKSDVLVWVDQASASTLTNKITGVGDVTVGTNLMSNGDCEGNWGFSAINSPNVCARSSVQAYSGIYSWYTECTQLKAQGVLTPKYTTKTGDVITYSFRLRRSSGSYTITYAAYRGSDGAVSIAGSGGSKNAASSPIGSWVECTGGYTETVGGSLAYIKIQIAAAALASWYVDNFVMSINGVIVITLPVNLSISDSLINSTKYYDASGNPLNVRTDTISPIENNQVFFDSSYKILIYNKSVEGKTLAKAIEWISYSEAIADYLSLEKTYVAPQTNKSLWGSPSLIIGSRIYGFYRDGRRHVSDDGVIKVNYSDDGGATFSEAITRYTGQEIINDNPQILIDNPRYKPDCRHPYPLLLTDDTVVIILFVCICYNGVAEDTEPADHENIDDRTVWGYKAVCLKIPISGIDLDWNNMTISYLPYDDPIGGQMVFKDGVLYTTTYGAVDTVVRLHKSVDYGVNWAYEGVIFSSGNLKGNETALAFSGNTLYAIARGTGTQATKMCICKSVNNGLTWTNYTELSNRIDGPFAYVLSNGKILVLGRDVASPYKIVMLILDDLTLDSDIITVKTLISGDGAYGTILKYANKYLLSYGNGEIADYPNKFGYANVGSYFKSIYSNIIDSEM